MTNARRWALKQAALETYPMVQLFISIGVGMYDVLATDPGYWHAVQLNGHHYEELGDLCA